MGYNFAQTFDRTAVRPEEHPMSTATLTRPTTTTGLRYAGCGEPVRAVQPSVATRRVRLTRRGRALLVLLCAVLLLAAVSIGRTGSQAATATGTGPTLSQTTVQPGETLWTVARRIAPQNDPREVVAQIRRINHLQSSSLRAGQQLLLPVR
jgi:hypothetical protein